MYANGHFYRGLQHRMHNCAVTSKLEMGFQSFQFGHNKFKSIWMPTNECLELFEWLNDFFVGLSISFCFLQYFYAQ